MSATDQVEDTAQKVHEPVPTKTTDDKDPLFGPSKEERIYPVAFSMLEKIKILDNPGCLSPLSVFEDRSGVALY